MSAVYYRMLALREIHDNCVGRQMSNHNVMFHSYSTSVASFEIFNNDGCSNRIQRSSEWHNRSLSTLQHNQRRMYQQKLLRYLLRNGCAAGFTAAFTKLVLGPAMIHAGYIPHMRKDAITLEGCPPSSLLPYPTYLP